MKTIQVLACKEDQEESGMNGAMQIPDKQRGEWSSIHPSLLD